MNQEVYEPLEIEVIEFEVEDVIRTSTDENEGEHMPLGMGF